MEKIIVSLDVQSKEGVKEVEKLNKKLSNTKTEANDAGKSLDSVSGGAITKFNALRGSITNIVKGFKSLKFAIIASGIGALLIAVVAVGKAFTSSEEGQNKFAKILGVIGAITGNLVDLIADLGENIISVFENPKKSLQDFGNLIRDNIINRFNGLLELIPSLGKAVKQLFTGDFSGAATTATNAVAKVTLGTDNLTESIKGAGDALKDFGKQNIEEGKAAAKVADDRAKADKIERDLIVDRANAENEIAELRLIAKQQNKFSAKEREEALIKAGKIQDELIVRETEVLKLRSEAIILENTFSRSNKENLDAEAQGIAAVIKAETGRINFKRQLARELTAAQNEQQAIDDAEQKKIEDVINKEKEAAIKKVELEAKTETERLNKIAKIEDDFKNKREEELAVTNIQKLELEKERKILELEQLGADEQAKADVILFYSQKIAEENASITEKANKQEVEDAKAISLAKAQILDAQLNTVARGFNLLGQLAGKNKTLQAAALVGEAAVSIAKMVAANNLANVGALATPQAILTGGISAIPTIAFNNVSTGVGVAATIAATSKGLASLGGGGSAPSKSNGERSSTPPAISSLPPAFNVVGQSDTNQLADAIGGQSKVPQRAYVVSGDVKTSLELDRNIIKGASI
jgi:hypothetical protein